jgi:hypothetical protein
MGFNPTKHLLPYVLGTVQVKTSTYYILFIILRSMTPKSSKQGCVPLLTKKRETASVPEYLPYRGAIAYGTAIVVIMLRLILHVRFLATFLSADASVPRRRTLLPWVGPRTDPYPPWSSYLTYRSTPDLSNLLLSNIEPSDPRRTKYRGYSGGKIRPAFRISILATSRSFSTMVLCNLLIC